MNNAEAPARPHYAPGVPAQIEPVTEPLDSLLWRAARDYPDRIAIDFLGRTITYSELATLTGKTATALYRCGVRRGDTVALIMPNCPQHIAAFYAVLTLGATVAEHNPMAPARELHEQLENHGGVVAVVWEQTLARIVEDGDFHGHTYLSVDLSHELPHLSRLLLTLPLKSAKAQRAKIRGDVPAGVLSFDRIVKKAPVYRPGTGERPGLDDVAVLIHTGGTTGVPKAVQLTHRNIMSNIAQTITWIQGVKRGEEVIAGVLPFFHAFGLQTVLGVGIAKAATILLLPNFDVAALMAGQRRQPITLFPGVAPMFDRFLKHHEKERAAGKVTDITSIAWAFSGAMALDPALAHRWEEATGGYIIEGYGMTEASPIMSGSPVSPERRPSTLGVPFPSTEIRLADPHDLSKDATDVGEILVRGPQVFVGYLGAPEETEKVFYDGWLRTGDLGRWDDGFLVMADRQKEMIIQGGFNVYPSQVENAIKSMPGVRDVAVVGMPDENRGESVVAVLVLEPGAAVDLDAVRRWTQDKLSHYAMPKSIAVRDNLPRSQIGKVMRRVVKEELAQSFELHGGQWKKIQSAAEERAEALSAAVSASVTGLSTHVAEQLAATKEQLTEKFAQAGSAKKHASSTQPAGAPAQSAETPDGAPEASASESPSAPSAA
ncbi:MAG: AMP-binding protein [Ancrocorticia sp.]|jgi:long-chain acyl-CoA synthetase|nr:AMP-binding protein [Ancrocorticia sp.]MCI2193396.1 AMP-binding protein [Ancrocorticia sp.]MCI2198176.1 AMP-binding protein [Ancrocorticia sp.]